jgi:hypothetical protein
MAKFMITFVNSAGTERKDEEVIAEYFQGSKTGEFVDFYERIDNNLQIVARYRAADIERILRDRSV